VISLCDYTGVATKPWSDAGYAVIHVDPQREDNCTILEMIPIVRDAILTGRVAFVMGFPPCTDVAVSGSAHFKSKLLEDPHVQTKAALIAEQCRMIGELSGAPWFFENPISVFSSIFGKPDYIFNPFEFGTYLKMTFILCGLSILNLVTHILKRPAYGAGGDLSCQN